MLCSIFLNCILSHSLKNLTINTGLKDEENIARLGAVPHPNHNHPIVYIGLLSGRV